MPSTVLSMAESSKPAAYTLSPLLPNTLRILVLVEASNNYLIIGAYQADPSGELAAGKSYVVFGKTNSSTVNLSAIYLAIDNKTPYRVACISNNTQINGTAVGLTKYNII
jgi:hypothetical protein